MQLGLEAYKSRFSFRSPQTVVLVFFLGLFVITNLPPSDWVSNITGHYLPIHVLLEFMGILVSFAVFTVGWATYQNVRSADILVLSICCFIVGWLDLGHTLSFTGMPDFVTPSGPDKAIWFWLSSRVTSAVGFLFVAISNPRESKIHAVRTPLMIFAVLWTALWYYLILFEPERLPRMFIPGQGLTPLKVFLEWSTVMISLVAGALFFRRGVRRDVLSFHWMGCACLLFAMSGFFFTMYRDFDDLYNFSGHIYKAVAFLLVYRAVFVECISTPYLEARRLAVEASQASISKSRFLANVSHEFRTPLGVISGFSDLLLQSKSLDGENRQWAETISRNSAQLRVLIDDLLDLAKAENERVSIELSDFSAVEVVEDVINSLKLQAERKGVKLIFHSEILRAHAIRSDRVRFRQVLLNVVGNALKFTSKGEVRVTMSRPGGDVIQVEIQDSGIGISAQEAERLFRPFAQADDPSKRRFGGTGLGLALSKKLSLLLGGDLVLMWSEPGQGSLFRLTVLDQKNVSVKERREVSSTPALKGGVDLTGVQILAAEDSHDNQSLLALYLKPTNATLTFANNGVEAVKTAQRGHFDLILMDIQMPEMDGFEAVQKLRQENWKGPILALTAHAHQPERERALQGGFDGYLVKPLSREMLWGALKNALNESGRLPKS